MSDSLKMPSKVEADNIANLFLLFFRDDKAWYFIWIVLTWHFMWIVV